MYYLHCCTYLVTFWGVVGVVQWVLVHSPLAVTLGTEEGHPAPVEASRLGNVWLRVDLGQRL